MGKPHTQVQGGEEIADPVLNLRELCQLLKALPDTIYQLTHRGRIPHFKIANRLRFQRSEILAWIEEHRVKKDRG